jgi:glycosyltransferase involved in cell wall biosynthesis
MKKNKKKKIVFSSFTKYPDESVGGPNKVIYQILKKLNFNSFEPQFISSDTTLKSMELKELLNQNYNYKPLKRFSELIFNKSNLFRKILTSNPYMKYHLHNKFQRWKNINAEGDVLHSHDTRSFYYLHKNFNKKILTIHSKGSIVDDFLDAFPKMKNELVILKEFSKMENHSLMNADSIVFPSNAAKNLFFEKSNNSEVINKSVVIYNGVDVDKIQSIQIKKEHLTLKEKNKKLFLTVGKFSKLKRVDLIIKSLAELVDKKFPVKLIIVGDGPLEDQLKTLVKKLHISDNVIFSQPLNNEDVISLMKCADVFIMASEKVIFDMVILEALAAGCRVIANNDGGNKEIIIDGLNGHLANITESSDLTDKILSIDFDKKLVLSETQKKIDINSMYHNYLSLYELYENKNLPHC